LYTSRLLERLRSNNPQIEMAVLAAPGREIDGHIEELVSWREEIDPDVIIYQWYINDIELDKSERPAGKGRLWRKLFFHGSMMRISYLWFFLDYHVDLLLTQPSVSYDDYIRERYAEGTPGWRRFETMFRAWAVEAKGVTPRVMVVLYPHFNDALRAEPASVHAAVSRIAREQGIAVLDLADRFDDLGPRERFATPFDNHPSAVAHERIAEALDTGIRTLWSELVDRPGGKCFGTEECSARSRRVSGIVPPI